MRETQLKLVLYSHSPSTLTNTATGKTTQTFLTALVNNSLLAVEVIAFMKINNHFFFPRVLTMAAFQLFRRNRQNTYWSHSENLFSDSDWGGNSSEYTVYIILEWVVMTIRTRKTV